MSREVVAPRRTPLLRGFTLWTGVSLTAGALPVLLDAEIGTARRAMAAGTPGGVPFDSLLAAACAVVLCACAAWAWLVTTATLAVALAGSRRRLPGCPEAARRLVLAACGLATLVATTPAEADPGAGSPPMPETAVAALPRPGPAPVAPVLRVEPGDSLWTLAQATLPPAATDADVDHAWRALWAANREAVGPDPDLIRPGTLLRRPTPKEHR